MRQYYASDRKKREEAKRRKKEEKRIKRLSRNAAKTADVENNPAADSTVGAIADATRRE